MNVHQKTIFTGIVTVAESDVVNYNTSTKCTNQFPETQVALVVVTRSIFSRYTKYLSPDDQFRQWYLQILHGIDTTLFQQTMVFKTFH